MSKEPSRGTALGAAALVLSVVAVGLSVAGNAGAVDVQVLKVWSSATDCPDSSNTCAYLVNGEVTSADIADNSIASLDLQNRQIQAIDLIRNVIADSSYIAPAAVAGSDAANAVPSLYAEAIGVQIPSWSVGVPTAREIGFGGSDWAYTTHPTGWASNDYNFGQSNGCRDSLGEFVEGAGSPCFVIPKSGLWVVDLKVTWHTDGSFEPGFPADGAADWMSLAAHTGRLVDGICTVYPETGQFNVLPSQKVSPNSLLTPDGAPNDRIQTYRNTAFLSAGDCVVPAIAERSETVTADVEIVLGTDLSVLSTRGGTITTK